MRHLRVVWAAALALTLLPGQAAAQEVSGLQVLVDDAATAANASLVEQSFTGPGGAQVIANLPPGFSISLLASGLQAPRFMTFDQAGSLLVADDDAGRVYRYPASSDGADARTSSAPPPLLDGLDAPSSLALHDGYLYVGETRTISRYPYDPSGAPGAREAIVTDLPRGGHNTRTVAFGADGALHVSVGSSCNICTEGDERRAAVLRFAPDGSGYERFAWGLRNAVGLAVQPNTGLLWATVNERDNQGNEIPPDLVTIVRQGENFGWPACRPPEATPQAAGSDCSGITQPTIGIQAHSAPLGLAFYTGQQFPSDYADDLFVVQHGSWNRQPPAAPKILRVQFEGAQPVGVQDFATGWQRADGSRWGRPVGATVAPDGSLIVSDDSAGALYRITYNR